MILYIENPKETIRNLLELISEFSKVTGYQTHRNPLHSYTLTIKNKKEKLNNSINYCNKKNEISRNKLPKETKELYIENYKTLMKEIKDDINIWRNIPCSWVGRINIVKMTILPNSIYKFNAISMK